MQSIYWSLGQNYWKQIIDADCHDFGPEVFDKGLHGGPKEPGFLKSLHAGMRLASDHLGKPLSVSFYRTLHKTLCSHFAGALNDTLIHGSEAGKYRTKNLQAIFALKYSMDPDMSHHYFFQEITELYDRTSQISRSITYLDAFNAWKDNHRNHPHKLRFARKFIQRIECEPNPERLLKSQRTVSTDAITQYESLCEQRAHKINYYAYAFAKELDSRTFALLSLKNIPITGETPLKSIVIDYLPMNPDMIGSVLERLFIKFNDAITITAGRKEKLTLIADLYQKLEWLHPFPDGQGRTDLVLLSKLLTENGFHPVILEQPYFSSTSTLDEWVDELERGLVAWEKVYAHIHEKPDLRIKLTASL